MADGLKYEYEYEVQGENRDVHVTRVWVYADSSLAIGSEVRDIFGMLKDQGEYKMATMLAFCLLPRLRGKGCAFQLQIVNVV